MGSVFELQDKLKQLYISWRRKRQIIHRFSAYATLYIADLRSVCPSSLLEEDPNKNMPWLSDNVSVLTMFLCLLYNSLLGTQHMTLHTVHVI